MGTIGKEVIGMDKAYKVLKMAENTEYAYLIVLCNANSPYDYLETIAKELDKL